MKERRTHFQSDFFNGWEEDGEPMGEILRKSSYEPHALEMHITKPKIISEKTIFLNPNKYKFNIQTEKKSIIERFLYWLLIG